MGRGLGITYVRKTTQKKLHYRDWSFRRWSANVRYRPEGSWQGQKSLRWWAWEEPVGHMVLRSPKPKTKFRWTSGSTYRTCSQSLTENSGMYHRETRPLHFQYEPNCIHQRTGVMRAQYGKRRRDTESYWAASCIHDLTCRNHYGKISVNFPTPHKTR